MSRIIGRPLEKFEHIDHINGDGLDNRRDNLRICTRTENVRCQRKRTKPTSSRFKGVTWHKNHRYWQAAIRKNGERTYLGWFKGEEEAARAYDKAAKRLHGDFASLNFPQ